MRMIAFKRKLLWARFKFNHVAQHFLKNAGGFIMRVACDRMRVHAFFDDHDGSWVGDDSRGRLLFIPDVAAALLKHSVFRRVQNDAHILRFSPASVPFLLPREST